MSISVFLLIFFFFFFFFFNDTATTEIYTLSLHDALPITRSCTSSTRCCRSTNSIWLARDRKSTRLNSSHQIISYAVFCLKKKKNNKTNLNFKQKKKTKNNYKKHSSY